MMRLDVKGNRRWRPARAAAAQNLAATPMVPPRNQPKE